MSGEVGLPMRSAYCASKFAVHGWLEALRIEMADGANVTEGVPVFDDIAME